MTKEWEKHRARIERLYKQRNIPLKDVKDIMKRKHGFDASLRSYRYYTTEIWGMRKNNTKLRHGHPKVSNIHTSVTLSSEESINTDIHHLESPGGIQGNEQQQEAPTLNLGSVEPSRVFLNHESPREVSKLLGQFSATSDDLAGATDRAIQNVPPRPRNDSFNVDVIVSTRGPGFKPTQRMEPIIYDLLIRPTTEGQVEEFKRFLQLGITVEESTYALRCVIDQVYTPPANSPLWNTRSEITELLLCHGADVDRPNYVGRTAIHMALDMDFPFLSKLLAMSKDVSRQDILGRTALHALVEKLRFLSNSEIILRNCLASIEQFLCHGANPNVLDSEGNSPFHELLLMKWTIGNRDLFNSTINSFFTAKVDASIPYSDGRLPFDVFLDCTSVAWGCCFEVPSVRGVIIRFLKAGGDPNNTIPVLKKSFFSYYLSNGLVGLVGKQIDCELMVLLCESGNVHATGCNGRGALHSILTRDYSNFGSNIESSVPEALQTLLKRGANPDLLDDYGKTPMQCLLENITFPVRLTTRCAKLLLDSGADPLGSASTRHRLLETIMIHQPPKSRYDLLKMVFARISQKFALLDLTTYRFHSQFERHLVGAATASNWEQLIYHVRHAQDLIPTCAPAIITSVPSLAQISLSFLAEDHLSEAMLFVDESDVAVCSAAAVSSMLDDCELMETELSSSWYKKTFKLLRLDSSMTINRWLIGSIARFQAQSRGKIFEKLSIDNPLIL